HHPAVWRLEIDRVLRVQAGGLFRGVLGESRCRAHEGKKHDKADHLISLDRQWPVLPANRCLMRASTGAGTKADTSPPMDAIWRTSVAVIGRASAEAGTKTVVTSGAMVSFIPAICIS